MRLGPFRTQPDRLFGSDPRGWASWHFSTRWLQVSYTARARRLPQQRGWTLRLGRRQRFGLGAA